MSPSRDAALRGEAARLADRADLIARRMDNAFRIPGTRITFGLDTLLGLVPGIGDTLVLAPAAYIIKLAHEAGLPRRTLARMGMNVGIDWVIGLVPVVGDLFDLGYKANLRNAALLRAHLEAQSLRDPAQEADLTATPTTKKGRSPAPLHLAE